MASQNSTGWMDLVFEEHLCGFKFFPIKNNATVGFPGGAVVENLPANAGDTGSSPGLGGSHMPRNN